MERVCIEELTFDNKAFWHVYFLCGYGEFYCEELDMSVMDMEEEINQDGDLEYWNEFTGWYEGIFEESDGYLDEPTYLETYIDAMNKTLKIEFHPGETVYFLDGEEIGCIGPHSVTRQPLSFTAMKSVLDGAFGDILFFLLFPMVELEEGDRVEAGELFLNRLISTGVFDERICSELARIIIG